MLDVALPALAAGLCGLGFALLALAQDRHYERVFEQTWPSGRASRAQRVAGGAAVLLALPTCIAADGAGLGSLLWGVLTMAAAAGVALTLTWRPRLLRVLRPWVA